jgi:hypothetical protein
MDLGDLYLANVVAYVRTQNDWSAMNIQQQKK